eukprot:m.236343 g.236343  ORF g.236343 m.236343 type:complete len:271 (-) comp20543_c0_seq1:39-851(-)
MSDVVSFKWVEKISLFGFLGITACAAMNNLLKKRKRLGDGDQEHLCMDRVQKTFLTLGFGVSVTTLATSYFFRTGSAAWLLQCGKWTGFLTVMGTTCTTLLFTRSVPRNETAMKVFAFGTFNFAIGFSLAPLLFLGGPLCAQAAAGTAAIAGSLCLTGVVAPSRKFFFLAAPLSSAVIILGLGSLTASIFPGAVVIRSLSLYGSLVAASLFLLYDTNVMVERARTLKHYDPIDECLTLYLDVAEIFVRLLRVLAESQAAKEKKRRDSRST